MRDRANYPSVAFGPNSHSVMHFRLCKTSHALISLSRRRLIGYLFLFRSLFVRRKLNWKRNAFPVRFAASLLCSPRMHYLFQFLSIPIQRRSPAPLAVAGHEDGPVGALRRCSVPLNRSNRVPRTHTKQHCPEFARSAAAFTYGCDSDSPIRGTLLHRYLQKRPSGPRLRRGKKAPKRSGTKCIDGPRGKSAQQTSAAAQPGCIAVAV